MLGPLGLAARKTGDSVLARQAVAEALEIGVELGAFMPVMHALPAAALLLADLGLVERALEVYACASRYEFVANSCWFEDVAGAEIRSRADSLAPGSVEQAQARGRLQDWTAMAAALLDEAGLEP